MRHVQRSLKLAVTVIVLLVLFAADRGLAAQADPANAPSLTISQLKITSSNGQFVTLYNATDTVLDMSKFQLEYFNNYDLAKATSSKLITLSGNVPPHGYFMVSDDVVPLCYQMTVDSVSLGLSSTAGLIEVLAFGQASPGGSVTPELQDYVGWSKTAAAGAVTLPSPASGSLLRQPVDAVGNPAVSGAGGGSWLAVQPAGDNACSLINIVNGAPAGPPVDPGGLLPGAEPPAVIETVAGSSGGPAAPSMPPADVGLMAPGVTELLPNPAGTGNDATDEFIELYNPNPVSFDLTGFILQTGTTSLHTYTFPAGSALPAKSFKAFYSAQTGVSLSNSGGQAQLLDPFGNSISHSAVYSTAKDGQAWALAKGTWYWSTKPTPGAANVVDQPAASKSKKAKTSKTKTAKTTTVGSSDAALTGDADDSDTTPKTPIHAWTLAAVAAAALLYGAYEYRADLANRIHEFKRYFGAGAPYRQKFARRRND